MGKAEMWTTRSRLWEQALVTECEAFLTGRYWQWLLENDCRVPAWAWVNKLAHGTEEEINAYAAIDSVEPEIRGGAEWHMAVAFLAQETIGEAANRGVSLARLQRSVLVPLELELLAWRTSSVDTPTALVTIVREALSQSRTGRRR